MEALSRRHPTALMRGEEAGQIERRRQDRTHISPHTWASVCRSVAELPRRALGEEVSHTS